MKVLSGACPDSACQKQLFFSEEHTATIECSNCGQRHEIKHLVNVEQVSDPGHALRGLLHSLVEGHIPSHVKKSSEFVKVKGLSNFGCKLISPLLTTYGLKGQEVRLLKDMNQGETFDCSHLADRAFLIEEQNLLIPGYGKDTAASYLHDTLDEIAKVNDNEERLIPIHADGDGHCLPHAISRALVGHELFWHPLLTNLKLHFMNRLEDYKNLFKDFIEIEEWKDIIDESDPNFVPKYGEMHGLRNIHILGLANILHRPVILIDSLEGMKSKGDYSGVFLPGLVPIEKCRNKNGKLHKPIVISWSSKGRNHFIPLVGIQNKELPRFPAKVLPKVWGLSQNLLTEYIDFEDEACIIGGNNSLQEKYLIKLTQAMERQFLLLKGVATSVVTDVYHHLFRSSGLVGLPPQTITEAALGLTREERLYKCLYCHAVMEEKLPCAHSMLEPGGELFQIAIKTHGVLKDKFKYRFPVNDIICQYDKQSNRLKYVHTPESLSCPHCKGALRKVKLDGNLEYMNGDQLSKLANNSSCGCGYKHYWDGKEYDNLPIKIPLELEWDDETVDDHVYWFQNESDPTLNSNAFELAREKVQEHFPGTFGSERLAEKIVDTIFEYTTAYYKDTSVEPEAMELDAPTCIPTKIILTGEKSKTLHKEELGTSRTERIMKKKIEHKAPIQQKRASTSNQMDKGNETNAVSNSTSKLSSVKDLGDSPTREKVKKSETTINKIRISCQDKGNTMFTLESTTSFDNLVKFIKKHFDIENEDITMKYGFPPKPLNQNENNPEEPLTMLKAGDRVNVIIVKKVRKEDPLPSNDTRSNQQKSTQQPTTDKMSQFASQLAQIMGQDLWEWACSQRNMFQVNGWIYKMAFRDLGLLTDDQHLSLPCFPKKIFVYNKKEDEIYLCLGKHHIFVQPLTRKEEELAAEQAETKAHELKPSIHHQLKQPANQQPETDNSPKVNNFSGEGYMLANNEKAPENVRTIRQTIDFATFGREDKTIDDEPMVEQKENESMDT
ncbi:deubiquitinating protein VCPIP1-like [Clytia hemisphaerica]|uniref:ubiquitinyl hydrolase 1 n=1 Tax=Clytia hemisphaerica TaxID=252671 RepID=A0A7M5VB72_9CNID